jgi:cellulose synthase/poly-beta-1,6-N-acetylglucosamine synthase-like glycosyltransferase
MIDTLAIGTLTTIGGTTAAAAVLPGTLELLVLTIGAILPTRRTPSGRLAGNKSYKLAVVVPAHNEEQNIVSTISSILAADSGNIDLHPVIVADNCSDHTAEKASAGRVLVRNDEVHRGKGYALDFAFRTLLEEGFDGFLVVDADTSISRNTLQEVVRFLKNGADAVQCRYLVRNSGQSIRTRLMSLALMAFNVLRPRGRDRLGLSAGINGNGFGLSAETLRAIPYGAASVVEDLEYHLDLVRSGRRVRFINAATVSGDMPVGGQGVKTQRTRWEGGRFRMLRERAPALAAEALRGRFRMLEPLGDLVLLPLAYHSSLLLIAAAIPYGPSRLVGIAGLAVLALHLVTAIVVGGGGWKDALALAAAPFYVIWKLVMLSAVLKSSKSKTAWVRTERPAEGRTR